MKYYAVTDDPNELMHFGIKGMKWGVIRTDAQLGHPKKPSTRTRSSKPRTSKLHSPAYMKASAKLSSAMQRGIAKAQTKWNVYNSPENKQLRAEKRAVNKAIRDFNRGERKFEKHVQLARQGRLKYKGIPDAEVQRITDRLALERSARSLSGSEKPSFFRRAAESIGNGVVQGVGQAAAANVSERLSRKSKLKTQRLMTEQANKLREKQADKDFARYQREQQLKDRYADYREKEKSAEELRNKYADEADSFGSFSMNGKAYTYNQESAKDRRRLSESEMRKRLQIIADARDEKAYRVKRNRTRSENEEQDARDLTKAERQMVRDVMRDKRTNEMAIYNARNKEYTERLKNWNPASGTKKPPAPSLPKFSIDDYYTQYDELVRKRKGRR